MELASKYQETGKPDSASYWLEWGEERLPFDLNSGNLYSISLYAYSYVQAGNDSSAVDLARHTKGQLMENLRNSMGQYDELEQQIAAIDAEIQSARENADRGRQQELQGRKQQIASQRKSITQDILASIRPLTIVQRIYFMAGHDQRATDLASEVDSVTMSRVSFPSTKEENKKQFEQFQTN